MRRVFLFFIFLFIPSLQANAQSLKGIILDSRNNPIPFSTVFVREISFGTAANQDGAFELKIPEGKYTCVFQSMGYETRTEKIYVDNNAAILRIVLQDMVYSMKEVVISAKEEDPAYRIMRKVIGKAPWYAKMVKSYNADVYIKGSLYVKKISRMIKWMAKDELKKSKIKEGDTYLEESINEIDFTSPNFTRQKVKSLHSTFPDDGEKRSSNAIGFISGSIYKPKAFGNAISPLSPGAFSHYRFRYEGVTTQGNLPIYKIKVIPRGDGPQYVSGHLYIVDRLWCINSLDITQNEQLGVTIHLNQTFSEVKDGTWLPVSNHLVFDVDLLGNEANFSYHTSIRYNKLVVNSLEVQSPKNAKPLTTGEVRPKTQVRKAGAVKKAARKEERVKVLMQVENPTTVESYKLAKLLNEKADQELKDSLRNNHELIQSYKTEIDTNARKHDSVFWKRMRPIPLANNEQKSVIVFDSLMAKRDSLAADTLKAGHRRKQKLFMVILKGGDYAFDTLKSLKSDGLINLFGPSFNTVDGMVYKTGFTYKLQFKNKQTFMLKPSIGYAFSRKATLWDVNSFWNINSRKAEWLNLNFGEKSQDFNNEGGPSPIENSIATLFFRENLVRLYNTQFVALSHKIEITNGLSLTTKLAGSNNQPLANNSNYSFFYKDSRLFSLNITDNTDYRMEPHRNVTFDINLIYKSMPYYYYVKNVKTPRRGLNDTPTFSLSWIKGNNLAGGDTDFDLLKAGISQHKVMNRLSFVNYRLEAGVFLNRKNLYFNEFKHFSAQPLIAGVKDFYPSFQLMGYYTYSTDQYYVEGHFQYLSPFILLKHLPVVRNRMWNESIFVNYLYVPGTKSYCELGYGIGNFLYNAGVFSSFEGITYRQTGFRISISIFGPKEIRF